MSGMVRKSSEKSNFALACSLLSQYIKEKRSVPDLGLVVAAALPPLVKVKSELTWPPPTMSLLPGVDVSGDEKREAAGEINSQRKAMELFPASSEKTAEVRQQERAQLTIFYGGKVLVFDDFPAEKVKDLVQLASKNISTTHNLSSLPPPSSIPAASITDNLNVLPDQESKPVQHDPLAAANGNLHVPPKPAVSNLPIAPRSSLQRFLEKRKHRINSKAPYQVGRAKEEESKSWLGLAPEVSALTPSVNSDYSS